MLRPKTRAPEGEEGSKPQIPCCSARPLHSPRVTPPGVVTFRNVVVGTESPLIILTRRWISQRGPTHTWTRGVEC